ncbi:MAG TPA: hypothetical protein VEJ87_02350 [Acidimicrobiales bacterium]|nr:hypothetical protein [Acidimicrobiales bacterium]
MEKLIYLLWGEGDAESGDLLRSQLLTEVAPELARQGVYGVGINVHDSEAAKAPPPVPIPTGELPHVAEVSLWVDCYDRRAELEKCLSGIGARMAGYLVVESLYDDYGTTKYSSPRDWPDGERSPGVLTVALIHKPANLPYEVWIRRWHGTQSPLSAELQPRTRYVRNEVVRPVTANAPEVDGIVEEAWPSAEHVSDPMLFYNASDSRQLNDHIERMLESVNACLDLGRLRSNTMSEFLILGL